MISHPGVITTRARDQSKGDALNQPFYVAVAGGAVIACGIDPGETFMAAGAVLMSAYETMDPDVHLSRIPMRMVKGSRALCEQAPATEDEAIDVGRAALRVIMSGSFH